MGVVILRIHHQGSRVVFLIMVMKMVMVVMVITSHQGRRGSPVPPNIRRVAKALAWVTRSSYPDTQQKLQDLEVRGQRCLIWLLVDSSSD